MTEEFLHYLWKYSLYSNNKLVCSTGQPVEVLKQGEHNNHSGPDFQNAKIKIGGTIWAGNVEIHIKSSDWYQHKHHQDRAYDNVILQVVYKNDKPIVRTNGEEIPCIEINFENKLFQNYQRLLESQKWIPCENELCKVDDFIIDYWLQSLTIERLEQKTDLIKNTLTYTKNSWEEAFYIQLLRNYGFKVNAEPFEMLAKSLPQKILAKHRSSIQQIEALLFGQAGFFEDDFEDSYFNELKKEYLYLKKKLNLKPLDKHLWRFMRLRPVNFPTVRIAQFAVLVFQSSNLFSKVIETNSLSQLKKFFNQETSSYWDNHYLFNKASNKKKKKIGSKSFENIVINTIIPFIFIYGDQKGREDMKEKALLFLSQISSEENSIIKKWKGLGIKVPNASYSQALIQLKNNYCKHKKCLDCQIGNSIIKGN